MYSQINSHRFFFRGLDPRHVQMAAYSDMTTTQSWKYTLAAGIIGVIAGLILFLEPALSLRLLIYFFGIIVLIIALVLLAAAAFFSRGSGPLTPVLLIIGLFFLVVGVLAFWKPDLIAGFVSVIAGIILIIAGLGMAWTGIVQKESVPRKILLAVGGIVLALLGISSFIQGGFPSHLIIRLLGVFVIVAGLVSLVGAFFLWRQEKKRVPEYIDATIVED